MKSCELFSRRAELPGPISRIPCFHFYSDIKAKRTRLTTARLSSYYFLRRGQMRSVSSFATSFGFSVNPDAVRIIETARHIGRHEAWNKHRNAVYDGDLRAQHC